MSDKVIEIDQKKESLNALLYKKKQMERNLIVYSRGAKVYTELHSEIQKIIHGRHEGSSHILVLKADLIEVDTKARYYIALLKETQRHYDEWLKNEVKQKLDPKDTIDFTDADKFSNDLLEYEIWGNTTLRVENIELPEILESIKKYIEVLENLNKGIKEELSKEGNYEYRTAKLEKDLFDNELHIQTLTKRLNERTEYYVDLFLPQYKKDMEHADKWLRRYIGIAREYAKSGIDPALTYMLEQYKENEKDKDLLWAFYTSLRKRLAEISKEIRELSKKDSKFKKYSHLAKKEFYKF